MTREKWAALTAEEQQIKIAKLCGWQPPFRTGNVNLHGFAPGVEVPEDAADWNGTRHWSLQDHVPDYLNDLNAMHEAEKILPDVFARRNYYRWLDIITGDQWNTIVATAAQRREAFVLTLCEEKVKPCIQNLLAAALMAAMSTGCGTFELAARPDPEHPSGYAAIQFWTPFGKPHAQAQHPPEPDKEH